MWGLITMLCLIVLTCHTYGHYMVGRWDKSSLVCMSECLCMTFGDVILHCATTRAGYDVVRVSGEGERRFRVYKEAPGFRPGPRDRVSGYMSVCDVRCLMCAPVHYVLCSLRHDRG